MQPGIKLNMLVVCQDEEYLKSIEYKLAEALAERVNISYISDCECLKIYNAQPKDIDILMIEEDLYKEVISRQNCKSVYLLLEDQNTVDRQESIGNKNVVYKYSSIRVIIDKIDGSLLQKKKSIANTNTKIVSVYSPIGGSGKTTIAVGLAKQLGMKGYKVLYISTETLSDYRFIINETEFMPEQIAYKCGTQEEKVAEELLRHVKKREFEFLLPWKRMLPAYGITTQQLMKIATLIQKKNIYDHIVIELSAEIQEQKLNFLNESDRVVLVTKQDKKSVERLKQFLGNVVEWKGLGVIVCNFFDAEKENYLEGEHCKLRYTVCEYIEKVIDESELQIMTDVHILEKTAIAVS